MCCKSESKLAEPGFRRGPRSLAITGVNQNPTTQSFTLSLAATASGTVTLTISVGVGTVLRYDTGSNLERIVVSSISGSTITATFAKAHASSVVVSDQGCLGWDADDLDSTVWNQTQVQNKYEGGTGGTSFPNFRSKLASDLTQERPGGWTVASATYTSGTTLTGGSGTGTCLFTFNGTGSGWGADGTLPVSDNTFSSSTFTMGDAGIAYLAPPIQATPISCTNGANPSGTAAVTSTTALAFPNIAAFVATMRNPSHIYYVAPSTATPPGNNSNSSTGCTITAPCLTITGGVSSVTGYSSQTAILIFARDGWTGQVVLKNGSSTNANIFMSYPGELATPTAVTGCAGGYVCVNSNDASYTWVRGVEILGSGYVTLGTNVGFPNPPSITYHDNILQNLDIRNPAASTGGLNGFDMQNILVEDVVSSDNTNQHSIYMGSRTFQSTGVIFQRILAHHDNWNATHWNGRCSGCLFQNSIAYETGIAGFDFQMGWNHSIIRSNLAFNVGSQPYNFLVYESGQCSARYVPSGYTGTISTGSNQVTSLVGGPALDNAFAGTVAALLNGYYFKGPGIPANTTILSGGGTTTLTLSANATSSGTFTFAGELPYMGAGAQICPYAENYNLVANNTAWRIGGTATDIEMQDTTEYAETNSQTPVPDAFGHETFIGNIFDDGGNNNLSPPVLYGQYTAANAPANTPFSCDSNCLGWLATESFQHNLFFQNDGHAGTRVAQTKSVSYYLCSDITGGVVFDPSSTGCNVANPQFRDASNSYAAQQDSRFDFRLLFGSPALQSYTTATPIAYFDLIGNPYLYYTPALGTLAGSVQSQTYSGVTIF